MIINSSNIQMSVEHQKTETWREHRSHQGFLQQLAMIAQHQQSDHLHLASQSVSGLTLPAETVGFGKRSFELLPAQAGAEVRLIRQPLGWEALNPSGWDRPVLWKQPEPVNTRRRAAPVSGVVCGTYRAASSFGPTGWLGATCR